ncbi:hypothetical protein CRUP_024209, partial [Coryphaenoides rupestris]
ALQSLSLADSRLRSRGTVLVNTLGSNTCLRKYMPLPLSDISQAFRSGPEKTEQALTKIQRALLRNNQTQRFSQRQALRLHQGLVTSTAEQVMERLCVRVQQQVCVLRGVGDMEEIQAAKQVLKEARSSRALYPSLCELAHVLSVDGPVRQRLDSLAGELAKAADKELQRLTPPLSSVSERVSVPRSAIRTALMERAAQDIHRALEEVKLSVVSYLTNSIVDQILQELYTTHKTLTRQVAQLKRWEGTCEGGTGQRSHRHRDSLEITDEELGTSITLDPEPESGEELFREECHAVAIAPTGTAMENVYTLLQPPPRTLARAESPGQDSADRRAADGQQWDNKALVFSPPPVQGIPHPGMGVGKHPFSSPKEKSNPDAEQCHQDVGRLWADAKPSDTRLQVTEGCGACGGGAAARREAGRCTLRDARREAARREAARRRSTGDGRQAVLRPHLPSERTRSGEANQRAREGRAG